MPTCSRDYSGTVITSDCITTPSSLPAGMVGVGYSETLTAPALTAPLVWVVLNGTLPDGLELREDSGEIFGVPTLVSNYSFQVQATDVNGLQCLKNFTLGVAEAGDGCGWWNDFPFTTDSSPWCVPLFTPEDLVGATLITAQTTQVEFGPCYLTIFGTKNYTGPPLILKIRVETTGEVFPGFIDVTGIFTFGIVGDDVQEFLAEIPESVGANYAMAIALGNTIQASITLTACESTVGATDGFYLVPVGDQPLFYYAPTGVANPTATITVASNKPITWDIANNFPDTSWAVAPSITLDGVPLTFHFEDLGGGVGNWVCDLATVETDGCVVKTFVISGPTIADPFGLGVFQIVPQS